MIFRYRHPVGPRTWLYAGALLATVSLLSAACGGSRKRASQVEFRYLDGTSCGHATLAWDARQARTHEVPCNAEIEVMTSEGQKKIHRFPLPGFSGYDALALSSKAQHLEHRSVRLKGLDRLDPWMVSFAAGPESRLWPRADLHSWERPYFLVLELSVLFNSGYHGPLAPEPRKNANQHRGQDNYCREWLHSARVFRAPENLRDVRSYPKSPGREIDTVVLCSESHANVVGLLMSGKELDQGPRSPVDLVLDVAGVGSKPFRLLPRELDNYSSANVVFHQYQGSGS